ncbi:TIMELESS-interacting protein [Canna indica]|uniref:TIMELESS-interacting protein n=1 Tax=Canna indica TaxID=4628 RepID=A0AAQ3JU18_9LILI|nr:TIMELESS-interacting protein [Canna indica]
MEKRGSGNGGAAPTGCFKCGRPGHWSRDCPSSSENPNPNPDLLKSTPSSSSRFSQQPPSSKSSVAAKVATKKAPKTRPKLTPDLLLSDDGLGYVLRHFPRGFKYRGRGHEVDDLGNLIGLYAQWHSHLIPYYSFDQFIHKVEKVGGTMRVRRCITELKDRVARGGDPTKLHEPPVEEVAPEAEQDDPMQADPVADAVDPSFECHEAEHIQEEMLDEIYHTATEDPCQSMQQEAHHSSNIQAASKIDNQHRSTKESESQNKDNQHGSTKESEPQNQVSASGVSVPSKIQISEEQRVRMEANRLKALERAAARARSQAS